MTRTFQHRLTLGALGGIGILLLLTFYFFWVKAFVLGLVLTVAVVLFIERMLHSDYVFGDGKLVINKGRFARRTEIALSDIKACRPMTTTFGMAHYLLIEYGDDKLVAVEPKNEQSFVAQLRKEMGR